VQSTPLRLVSRVQQQQQFEQTGAHIRDRLTAAGLTAIAANVEITTTRSGLRIELAESTEGDTFFPVASAEMKPVMRTILGVVAQELILLNNALIIEGHTDGRPYLGTYSNWELSADRANAARRLLEADGVTPQRIREVRGLADRDPRMDTDAYDARNRRITIVAGSRTRSAARQLRLLGSARGTTGDRVSGPSAHQATALIWTPAHSTACM
jgi:chemotaxis protein MotB